MIQAKDLATFNDWLAPFDTLDLECDGMTRVISTIMQRDAMDHKVCVGSLSVTNIGDIPFHWWIELPDDQICDLRARMWLGESVAVPHGLFTPDKSHVYTTSNTVDPTQIKLSSVVFQILTGNPLEFFSM